jgi:uncharacterized protein YqeY
VSGLEKKIQSDLVSAMKEKNSMRMSVLRMVKAEMQRVKADQGRDHELTDEEVISVVQRLVKQRREAADQYASGGAEERAAAELKEITVLEEYLPRQLSSDELMKIIREVAEEIRPFGPADMGKMMGRVMPKVKGLAEGNRVRKEVSRFLKDLED